MGIGDWLLILALALFVAGLAYGLFTETGSGIARHPWGRRNPPVAPGAEGPGETSGSDRGEHAPMEHGTK
jgi:hypothetical protein